MTPIEELIKAISIYIESGSLKSDYVTAPIDLLQQSVARLKELEREKEAYREVAATLYEWRFQRDPELLDKWDGKTEFGDEVDAEAQRLMRGQK